MSTHMFATAAAVLYCPEMCDTFLWLLAQLGIRAYHK